jgi:hypothetical protein
LIAASTTGLPADEHVTVAALVTAPHVVHASLFFQYPSSHVAARESLADEHVDGRSVVDVVCFRLMLDSLS